MKICRCCASCVSSLAGLRLRFRHCIRRKRVSESPEGSHRFADFSAVSRIGFSGSRFLSPLKLTNRSPGLPGPSSVPNPRRPPNATTFSAFAGPALLAPPGFIGFRPTKAGFFARSAVFVGFCPIGQGLFGDFARNLPFSLDKIHCRPKFSRFAFRRLDKIQHRLPKLDSYRMNDSRQPQQHLQVSKIPGSADTPLLVPLSPWPLPNLPTFPC